MVFVVLIIVLALLCGCSKSSYDFESELIDVATLRTFYHGTSAPITADVVIEGIVVGEDSFGEFPCVVVVCDKSGGVELHCQSQSLSSIYGYGSQVRLYCSGLWLGSSGQKLILGAQPTNNEHAVERLPEEELQQHLKLRSHDISYPYVPQRTISQISIADIMRPVELRGVVFASRDTVPTFCMRDTLTHHYRSTTHTLQDTDGNQIDMYVDNSCSYASLPVPDYLCRMIALVDYFLGEFSIRVTRMQIYKENN